MPYSLLGNYNIPEYEESWIYMDWITNLSLFKRGKNDAVLTIQSAKIKYLWLIPCCLKEGDKRTNLNTKIIAKLLTQNWFRDFGLPSHIMSNEIFIW